MGKGNRRHETIPLDETDPVLFERAVANTDMSFDQAYEEAVEGFNRGKQFHFETDTFWLELNNAEWVIMPDPLKRALAEWQPEADIHMRTAADQQFYMQVYPKSHLPTLADLIIYWQMEPYGFGRKYSMPQNSPYPNCYRDHDYYLETRDCSWFVFKQYPHIIMDDKLYISLTDFMRDQMYISLDGYWVLDGLVMDAFNGKDLDLEFYYVMYIQDQERWRSIETFDKWMKKHHLSKDSLWQKIMPDGEDLWQVRAALDLCNGNSEAFVLESEKSFLYLCYFWS